MGSHYYKDNNNNTNQDIPTNQEMSPRPKSVPSRLGPPPQLGDYKIPTIQQKHEKFRPKFDEMVARNVKMIARWVHLYLTWKRILMAWMVVLVASKMVLLMLTYQFFTLTSLISLQVFHGVWTIAFFCLTTTVLHILLFPNTYPLEYLLTDAVGTFLAIITMFVLLRMECAEILMDAEDLWEGQHGISDTSSDSGHSGTTTTSGSSYQVIETPQGRRILGNPNGPTVISVNGVPSTYRPFHMDSVLFPSLEEADTFSPSVRPGYHRQESIFDEAVDLEPIDFEHFEDDQGRNPRYMGQIGNYN
eukprot:TCALIF_01745-PA protein Name:"Protein of unknown function" AED:0.16 eAED:0.16 QI:0/0.5/0.2/1/0.25/0.4/5/179/302